MIVQVLAAAIGTVAFAALFGVPREYYISCGVVGGLGWLCYCAAGALGLSPTESTFLGTLVVVLLSRFCAVWQRCPVTVFLISGIIPLVPGAGIYWTAYYLVTNQKAQALSSGFAAAKAVVAIVLAIVIIFELPSGWFRIGRKQDPGREHKE